MNNSTFLSKIFFCIILSISLNSFSQTVSNNFQTKINEVFDGVDLTKVPHHLLKDYAMEFVDMSAFNGTATDTNYVHRGIYTSIYNTLLMARTQTNVQDLIGPDQFRNNWESAREEYTIALSGLFYKYSRLRPDAYPNDISISNNKLYDKYDNGVWQNPYETDAVFVMSAPIQYYNYLNMEVLLPASLWYTNQANQVQNIAVNFNDGNGYQSINFGQRILLSYGQEGVYDWDYKITLTNNQVLYSHSKIGVGANTAPISSNSLKRPISEPCGLGSIVNGFDQVEFQGQQTFLGIANTATIQIDYAGGNLCDDIRMPLIVAEGFESGLLGGENPLGDQNITSFRRQARNSSLNLRAEIDQYDIIYINWDQGRDDLHRNALLLEDIITWVNNTKTTTNQNVVLGQSMGGVTARYALRDMEDRPELNHDTELYISHDAPHQGANIPLGIQYFARHLINEYVSTPLGDYNLPATGGGIITIKDIQEIFNDTGTRQLIANNINDNFSLVNNEFDSWQTELRLKGYPQQTRNIAISNGSHCANDQVLLPQDELLFIEGDGGPTLLTDLIINYVPILNPLTRLIEAGTYVYLAIALDNPAYLAGLLPGRTRFNLRFQAKALPPAGQTANIYQGRIRIEKKIDFLLFSLSYNINITNRNFANPSQVTLPFDSYPGGFYPNTFDLSILEDNNANNWIYRLNLSGRSVDSFNFIPTTSALDVGGGSTTLQDSDYRRVYNTDNPPASPQNIPFDNFTSTFDPSGLNEAHISFNTINGNWLALELDNEVGNEESFDCSFVCNNPEISGPDEICTSAIYTVDIPTNAIVNWTIIPSNALTFTQGNPTTTFTKNGSFSGLVTISANISSNCGTITQSKSVYVGTKNLGLEYFMLIDDIPEITVMTSHYGYEVEWRLNGVKVTNNPSSGFQRINMSNYSYLCNGPYGGLVLSVRQNSECGWSQYEFRQYQCFDYGEYYQYYPNPTSSEVVIENKFEKLKSKKASNSPNITEKGKIQLFDFNNILVREIDYNREDKKFILPVSDLSPGHYILVVRLGGVINSHKIIIN